jgi:hypothetical protein
VLPANRARRSDAVLPAERRARAASSSTSSTTTRTTKRPAIVTTKTTTSKRFKSPTPTMKQSSDQGNLGFVPREKFPIGCKILLDDSIYPTAVSVSFFVLHSLIIISA